MKFISLFAGPGGMDVAAESLGIATTGIEWDANACMTRRAAGLATVEGDVREYGPADFPDCDSLMAGPPCQTFTVAGNGSGRKALDEVTHIASRMMQRKSVYWMLADLPDERTALVLEPLRWALEAFGRGRPYRNIVLEQVPNVLPVWEVFATYLQGLGYSTAVGVLRTEQYGVPQTRKRAVLVATLDGTARLPEPTHAPYRKAGPQGAYRKGAANDCVTMADVLDRPTPFTVISNYGTGGDPAKRGRRTSAEPAFTVTGKVSRNRLIDGEGAELPRLSHGEAGVLQSFPRDFPWSGSDVAQQIGNAAPPKLVRAVLETLLPF